MQISVVTTVPYPRDVVFDSMRTEMPNLVEYLPNIAKIEVLSEEVEDDVVRLVNRWQAAKTEIPAVARPLIDPARIYWIDHAAWWLDAYRCDWRLEMGFMAERVKANGATTYHEIEGGTELRIEGDLSFDLAGMLPRMIAKSATPKVEAFVVKMIEPNFQKTADALTAYLDANQR